MAPFPEPLTARAPFDNDGQDTTTSFLSRRSVRDTWIALWVMWILWALLFLARQFFKHRVIRRDHVVANSGAIAPNGEAYEGPGLVSSTAGVADPAVASTGGTLPATTVPATTTRPHQKGFLRRASVDLRERVFRTHDLVRDLTLMLLLVVTLNNFGRGSVVFVLILTWIYVGIAWMWVGLMLLIESRILDVMLGAIEMILLLAMLIAAYALGWSVFF